MQWFYRKLLEAWQHTLFEIIIFTTQAKRNFNKNNSIEYTLLMIAAQLRVLHN